MEIKSYEDLLQVDLTVSMGGQRLNVSIYLIDKLLIDTGPARKKKQLIPLYDEWEIDNIIMTHHHEDHTGLASWLQQNKNIPLYMHKYGVNHCMKRAKLPFYRHVFWGKREAFVAEVLGKTFQTENYEWDIIHTPGHADDHIALFNKEKGWLFGGDLYVIPKPKSMFKFESVPTLIQSLHKILTYDFDTYICSHAGIITNGKRAIRQKLDYLMMMQEKVLNLHRKGIDPKDIRKSLFPKRHPMHYLSFFENSPNHFIDSIINV